jgi:hypothetical protein
MNELLKALSLRHLEKGLPQLYEQARLHSLTRRGPFCAGCLSWKSKAASWPPGTNA